MYFIFLVLLLTLIMLFLPQLLKFVLIFFVISTIIRALMPRNTSYNHERRKKEDIYEEVKQRQRQANQAKPTDIIDVEYEEHEIED